MPTLVDTSVWVDLLRAIPTAQVLHLERLIRAREELLIGDLVLMEVLQGIREDEIGQVQAAFAAYRVIPLVGEEIARQSAANYRQLRRQGITVRKSIDCVIATWCIQNRVPLLHSDRDFTPFVELGLVETVRYREVVH